MRHNYGISICCLLCFLACQTGSHAIGYLSPELPNLVQEANTICTGRVTQIENLGSTQVYLGYRDSVTNAPVATAAEKAVAEVAVQSVIKGKIIRKSIKVAFFKNIRQGFNPAPFTELAAGETDILFLKATDDETDFDLSQPNSHGKSKITIGDAKIGPITADAPPLHTVLLALADALASGSKPVRMECLDRIGSVGYLLYAKAGVYVDEAAAARRSNLGEPLMADNASSSLEGFIRAKILPAILKLTTDKDDAVREQAFLAAGRLQDVDVIPALAQIADKQYKPGEQGVAASIFGQYRNPDATRPLVGVLSDSNPNVRAQAANALRNLADPLAVPFLLDHLDDPSPDAKYFIVTALYTATNTPHYPGTVIFQGKEDEYVSFWKKWASEHQDKIKALRAQFDAATPPKTTH